MLLIVTAFYFYSVKINIDKERRGNFQAYLCASNPGKFSSLSSRLIKLIHFSVSLSPLSPEDDAR